MQESIVVCVREYISVREFEWNGREFEWNGCESDSSVPDGVGRLSIIVALAHIGPYVALRPPPILSSGLAALKVKLAPPTQGVQYVHTRSELLHDPTLFQFRDRNAIVVWIPSDDKREDLYI